MSKIRINGLDIKGQFSPDTTLSKIKVRKLLDFLEIADRGSITEAHQLSGAIGAGHRKKIPNKPKEKFGSPSSDDSIDFGIIGNPLRGEWDNGIVSENTVAIDQTMFYSNRGRFKRGPVIIPASQGVDGVQNWSATPTMLTIDNPNSVGTSANDYFGYALAVHGDTAVIGAYAEDYSNQSNSGVVYVVNISTGELLDTLINPDGIGNGKANDNFGNSVDISEDYIIVGASGDHAQVSYSGAGSVYVFDRSDYSLLHNIPHPSPNQHYDRFGHAVAIDGKYAIVGAPNEEQYNVGANDSDANGGAVYIYDMTGTNPTNYIKKYDNPSRTARYNMGLDVDVSGDYAVWGAPYARGTSGRAGFYIHNIVTNTTSLITPPTASWTANSYFGAKVAIMGNHAVVTAYNYDDTVNNTTDEGIAYVYNTETGALLGTLNNPRTGSLTSNRFGSSVDISEDYIIVGSPYISESQAGIWNVDTHENSGEIYIFSRTDFSHMQTISNPNAFGVHESDKFGYSVAISGDYAIGGAWEEDDEDALSQTSGSRSGKAYIFDSVPRLVGASPTLDSIILSSSNQDPTNAVEGNIVSVTMKASKNIPQPTVTFKTVNNEVEYDITNTVTYESLNAFNDTWKASFVVHTDDTPGNITYSITFTDVDGIAGDTASNNITGNVTLSPIPNWSATPSMLTIDNFNETGSTANDYFGYAVAVHGDTAVIGAYAEDYSNQSNSGVVYVVNSLTGALLHTLINPDGIGNGKANDNFGNSVDISEDYIIVGASGDHAQVSYSGAGSVYVFDRSDYSLLHHIPHPSPNENYDNFGHAVAIDGKYAIVGAPNEEQYNVSNTDGYNNNGGAVYIYDMTGTNPTNYIKKYDNPSRTQRYQMGRDVDVSGDYAIWSAPYVRTTDFAPAIYIMHIPSNTIKPIFNPGGSGQDYFGTSLAIDGDKFVVGAQNANSGKGRAYVYDTHTLARLHTIDNPNNSTEDAFANAVDISDNRVILGSYLEDVYNSGPWNADYQQSAGVAYIFDALTGLQMRTLYNPNAFGPDQTDDQFGFSVSLSGDYAIVGARYEDDAEALSQTSGNNSGKAYIFDSIADDSATLPTLSDVNLASNNTDSTRAVAGNEVIVTFIADKIISSPIVTFYSGGSIVNNTPSYVNTELYTNKWTATYIVDTNDALGNVTYSIAFTDSYGNAGIPVTSGSGSVDIQNIANWSATPSMLTIDNPNSVGASANDYFGYAVAVHGDTAVIGAFAEDASGQSDSGVVYVVNSSTGALLHTLINPDGLANGKSSDNFGYSVDISEDYIIVGASGDRSTTGMYGSGSVYVFNRSDYSLLHNIPHPSPNEQYDNFGHSVAIDGKYAIVGAPNEEQYNVSNTDGNNNNGGVVYIYDMTGTNPTNYIKRYDNPSRTQRYQMGRDVDVSGDYAIWSAPYVRTTNFAPAIYIMHIPSNNIKAIYNPGGIGQEYFGTSLAIDGDKFVVGAQNADSGKGRAYIYDTNTLALLHTIDNPNNSTEDAFASAVDISDNRVIVGSYLEDVYNSGPWNTDYQVSAGVAYIFDALTGSELQTLYNPNAFGPDQTDDQFGYSVAISYERIIAGARYEDDADALSQTSGNNSGKAYIFDSIADDSATLPTLSDVKLLSNNTDSTRAVAGNEVIVTFIADKIIGTPVVTFYSGGNSVTNVSTAAQYDIYQNTIDRNSNIWNVRYIVDTNDTKGNVTYSIAFTDSYGNAGIPVTSGSGSVDIQNIANWSATPSMLTIDNPNSVGASANDYFGYAVAVHGDTAVIGAFAEDASGQSDSGVVYVVNSSTGALLHTLINPDGLANGKSSDNFGYSVDISEDYIIVGASGDRSTTGMYGSGSVYVFNRSDYSLLHNIPHPSPNEQYDNFGHSVAIDGKYAIVGAPNEEQYNVSNTDGNNNNGGVVYIYDMTGTNPTNYIKRYDNPSRTQRYQMGRDVDVSGDYAIWSAPYVRTTNFAPAIYIMHIPSNNIKAIYNPGGIGQEYFGLSVAIDGDKFVVGAQNANSGKGRAYVYDTHTLALLHTIDNPNNSTGDAFANAIAISDNRVVVGSYLEDVYNSGPWNADYQESAGVAYIFDALTGLQMRTLYNPNAFGPDQTDDQFGYSVAISYERIIAGARYEDDAEALSQTSGNNSGKAYIFDSIADDSTTLPTLSDVNLASNNTDSTRAVAGNEVIITLISDKLISSPIVTFYSGGAIVTNTPSYVNTELYTNKWTATYIVDTNDTKGNVTYSIAFTDSYGNAGIPVTSGSGSVDIQSIANWSAHPSMLTIDNFNETGSTANDYFGYAVAVHGDTAVIGAYAEDASGQSNSGVVYVVNSVTGALLHTLINPDGLANGKSSDNFGYSVDISEDYIIVGASGDRSTTGMYGSGSVYVFNRSDYSLLHNIPHPSPNEQYDNFGHSVAIDGKYAIVGAPNEEQSGVNYNASDANGGAVYIYDMTGTNPTNHIKKYDNPSRTQRYQMGREVDVSGDYAIWSAPYVRTDSYSSAIYIMHIPSNNIKAIYNPAGIGQEYFGLSIAIDGDKFVVGAQNANAGKGRAYVYDTHTLALLHTIDNPNNSTGDAFANAIDISDNRVIVGSYLEDVYNSGPWNTDYQESAGVAYIFDALTGSELKTLYNPNAFGPDQTSDEFGYSVAISYERIIVGARYEDDAEALSQTSGNNSGKAYIFDSIADDSTTLPTLSDVNLASSNQDSTRAVTGNEVTVTFIADKIIGTPVVTFYSGGATVTNTSSSYVNTERYTNKWTASYIVDTNDALGNVTYSIAFTDSYGNAGIPVTSGSGSVDIQNIANWSATPSMLTIDNPNSVGASANDYFGYAVAVHGDTAVIGAFAEDASGQSDSGVVYVVNSSTGALLHTLINPDGLANGKSSDNFGYSVDISEDYIIVGASGDRSTTGMYGSGSVYVFNRSDYSLLHNIPHPSPNEQYDNFGHSVAIDGKYAIVGAPNEEQSGVNYNASDANGGAVYIYDMTGTNPTNHIKKYDNPSRTQRFNMGREVDVSGDYAIWSAAYVRTDSYSSAIYIMHIPSNTIQPIYNPAGVGQEYFGLSVAIDGDKFVVGAQNANAGKGRAYVYDTHTLSLLHTIDNPNNSTGDAFANAIDISDNQIIVGSYLEDETGVTDSGKVFIFDALTGNHTRTIDNINADGSGDSDQFGYSVAVSNEKLIVGARYEDDALGSNSGKSYIFTSL